MERFLELLPAIVVLVGAVIAAAAAAAKLTKTKKDDEVIAKIDEAFKKVEDIVAPEPKDEAK
jgi:hypothetical protein